MVTIHKDYQTINTFDDEEDKQLSDFYHKQSDEEFNNIVTGKTTPVHIYCKKNDVEMVSILLFLHKFDVNEKDFEGNCPIHYIFHDKTLPHLSIYIIEFLLLHNGNINAVNKHGQTAIHLSCKFPLNKITKFLIFKNCNVDILDVYGKTPIMYACEFGYIEQVITLIEAGACVNVDKSHYQPLHIACLAEYDDIITQINIVHLLIDSDAHIDAQHKTFLYTPLHCCIFKGNLPLTEFLLIKGANPNIQQVLGNIPLHITDDVDIAKILVKYKSKLCVKNDIELTPIETAKIKNKEIYHYLRSVV